MSLNKATGIKCSLKVSLVKKTLQKKTNNENDHIKKSSQNNPSVVTNTENINHLFNLIITKVSGSIYTNMY